MLFRSAPLLACIALLPTIARAQNSAHFVSTTGTYLFVGAGLSSAFARDGVNASQHGLRSIDALGTTLIITEVLKQLIHADRPDGSGRDSFPSAHAASAFAIATMASQYHPKETVLWFLGATWIAQSRVAERKHNILDVLAGAGLGFGVARLELALPHGITLRPWIGGRGEAGVGLSAKF